MTNQSTETELATVELNEAINLGEAYERLSKNPDFKKVIIDGYMRQKALDSVSLLGDPHLKQQGRRPDIMEDLVSISNLGYYFKMISMFYEAAKQDLNEEV